MKIARFNGRALLHTASLLGLSAALSGCSNSDQMKRQIAGLEKQITAMRADEDRLEERLAQLELSNRKAETTRSGAKIQDDDRLQRPRLKVIRVAPDDAAAPVEASPAEPAPVESSGKRPVIRGTGDRVIKMFDAQSASAHGSEKPLAENGRSTGG